MKVRTESAWPRHINVSPAYITTGLIPGRALRNDWWIVHRTYTGPSFEEWLLEKGFRISNSYDISLYYYKTRVEKLRKNIYYSNISHKIKNKQENLSAKMKCYSGRMVFQYTVENERDMRSGVFLLSKLLLLLFCVITTHSRYVSCDGDDYI